MDYYPAAELANVGEPWVRTRMPDVNEPYELVPFTPDDARAVVRTLTVLFTILETHRTEIAESYTTLPEAFFEYSSLTWRWQLDDIFPRLTDASPAAVQQWLAENYDPVRIGMYWTAPPPDFAAAVYWAYIDGNVQQRMQDTTDWLDGYHRAHDLPDERRALIALIAQHIPLIPDLPAAFLVGDVGSIGKRDAIPFLTDLLSVLPSSGHARRELDNILSWVRNMPA